MKNRGPRQWGAALVLRSLSSHTAGVRRSFRPASESSYTKLTQLLQCFEPKLFFAPNCEILTSKDKIRALLQLDYGFRLSVLCRLPARPRVYTYEQRRSWTRQASGLDYGWLKIGTYRDRVWRAATQAVELNWERIAGFPLAFFIRDAQKAPVGQNQ